MEQMNHVNFKYLFYMEKCHGNEMLTDRPNVIFLSGGV